MFHVSKAIRKKQKKCIELLEQAILQISALLKLNKIQEVSILLAECQESAIALGTHIEKLHGQPTKTVEVLNQYCEGLYEVSVEIGSIGYDRTALDGFLNSENSTYMRLYALIEELKTVFEEECPERLEVVFLPYNASMWDSLESVWMAARDDENCNAYVIPIPYYNRDEMGDFKEFHYEGELYPDYVPITHYMDYDLELRHPDIVFIHNPYDNYNKVTSVLPEYYSSKIRAYTEKLIYIPYFVLDEIDPNNEVAIENMKHFCFLPGITYADKVIVQSEDMRQIYIKEYYKAAKEHGMEVAWEELEQKILGLGSPKYDKVTSEKDGIQIPKEWLKIIQKSDGSWKKIIFYNTSVVPFLNAKEQMLTKIQSVLTIFKENKEDIALLWRPHPLMEETISSLNPELWEAYQSIVRKYREESWGIYDDSSDFNRAVAISDAYYGDGGSVISVYQKTGKPVMMQNVEIV